MGFTELTKVQCIIHHTIEDEGSRTTSMHSTKISQGAFAIIPFITQVPEDISKASPILLE